MATENCGICAELSKVRRILFGTSILVGIDVAFMFSALFCVLGAEMAPVGYLLLAWVLGGGVLVYARLKLEIRMQYERLVVLKSHSCRADNPAT